MRFYLGDLIWRNEVYHIYSDKRRIRYRYSLEISPDKIYISEGFVELGIKNSLRRIQFQKTIKPYYIEKVLNSLKLKNISQLCMVYEDSMWESYYTDDWKTAGYTYKGIRTKKRPNPQSRKAFIRFPFKLKSRKYVGLEIKGCGCEGKGINFHKFRRVGNLNIDSGPEGGAYFEEVEKELFMLEKLYTSGKKSPLGIVAFELPFEVNSPFHGKQKLGLLVRGVTSSFRVSDSVEIGKALIHKIKASPSQFYRIFLDRLFNDLRTIMELGYYHLSPSDSNVHITGEITDLGMLKKIKDETDIFYNLHNFSRVAISLANYISYQVSQKNIVERIKEIFQVEGRNLKDISFKIYRNYIS